MAKGILTLDDSISKEKVEEQINQEDNAVWKDKMNFNNFIVIASDIPTSMQVEITMGFKNQKTDQPHNAATVKGQVFVTDWFRAKEIMSKSKEELYDAFIAKDETIILE
jgi:hypothetical protein